MASGEPAPARGTAETGQPHAAPAPVLSKWGPISDRDYRLFLVGGLTFSASLWIGITAVGWVALELTDSSVGVTVVNVVWFTPFFLLALPAGVIADAVDRRKLMIVARGLSALLLFAATAIALADQLTFPILLVIAAGTGSLIVIELPARQAFIAMLVPREQLVNAMALLSSEGSVSRVFGPLLSGYLLDRAGPEGAFFAFAVLSLVIVVATVAIRTPGRIAADAVPTRRLKGELIEGLRYLWGHQDARALVLLAVLAGSSVWVYVALLPVMTRDVLGGDALLLGVLSTSIGLGQIPAALLLAFYRNYPWAGRSYIAAMFVLGVAIVGYAYSTSVPLTLALLAVTGFAFSAQNILLNAMLLRLVEPRFHGRVIGAMSLTWGVNVVGIVTAGILVETFGVELAVGLSGVVLVVCALGAAVARPRLLQL